MNPWGMTVQVYWIVASKGKSVLAIGVYRDAKKDWVRVHNSEPFCVDGTCDKRVLGLEN